MKRIKKIWGASDYHFDHINILKYDNRPYSNIDDMKEDIISKHNELVHPDDDFFFLGDFCFNESTAESLLKSLNGRKFFIKGNHDNKKMIELYKKYGTYLGEQASYIKIDDHKVVFNHFRMFVWDQSHRGAVHFYGHSHGSLKQHDIGRSQDLFIGDNNYYPWNLSLQVKLLKEKEMPLYDKHGEEKPNS